MAFLDVHIDFTRNRKLALVRHVNVLVYLNEDWQPEWGGQLELWSDMDNGPVQEILPLLNRTVVFSTPDAAHGHPKPVSAPGTRSRLCFSAYYFTSPIRGDSSMTHHGVRFGGRKPRRRGQTLRRVLPPVVYDGLRASRRRLRDRRRPAVT